MTALTFTLKTTPQFKLDCRELTPNRLQDLSLEQIATLKLGAHKNSAQVSDYFKIAGKDFNQIVFKNSTTQLDYIGHEMKGGQITINGDAGDFLGANMQNGVIVCQGSAGDRAGDRMRRGIILIEGNVGNYTGSQMVAGTMGILGNTGSYTGFAMRRGTILLTKKPSLHATIQSCGMHTLPYLSLLFKALAPLSKKFGAIATNRVERFAGDLGVNGRGEILVLK
jgi:formylmethanofuran dehydrogenase subunit C